MKQLEETLKESVAPAAPAVPAASGSAAGSGPSWSIDSLPAAFWPHVRQRLWALKQFLATGDAVWARYNNLPAALRSEPAPVASRSGLLYRPEELHDAAVLFCRFYVFPNEQAREAAALRLEVRDLPGLMTEPGAEVLTEYDFGLADWNAFPGII
jgi:hypothetical protein